MPEPDRGHRPAAAPNGLARLLAEGAATNSDRTAVRMASGQVSLSYRELNAGAARVGVQLGAAGIEPGVPVGLAATNSLEFLLGLFGIASIGAVAAPLDPQLAASEIDTRLNDVNARALVVPGGSSPMARSSTTSSPVLALNVRPGQHGLDTSIDASAPTTARAPGATPLPPDCELIMFTAGSTGRSKAVPWTGTNVSASVDGIIRSLELTADDSTVLVMPMFHGHGLMTGLLATLATGGNATLPETGRFSAHRFWDEMVGANATWYTAVPTIHQIVLARAQKEYPGPDKVRLRFVRSCSAPLADSVSGSIEATFHARVVSAYGMTETAHQATSTLVRDDHPRIPVSVGVPTSVDVRIQATDGTEAADGNEGEILVRGDALTDGYLNDDQATKDAFVNGWFATGDLGRVGAYGDLYLTGRIKDLINRGGEKIAPSAVEAALLSHPEVLDAAAFGVPDETYGERVEAAVTRTHGSRLTQSRLRKYAADRLSSTELPDRILLLDRMPHTSKGAPDRRALIASATAGG